MDRTQLMNLLSRARKASDECERLRATEALAMYATQAAGGSIETLETALRQREAECDRHMNEMERLLDELDKIPSLDG